MNESLKTIADHYGKDAQTVQTVEELNELACAILHYRKRRCAGRFDGVVEEMADVEIMLEQIKYLYNIDEQSIQRVKQDKIDRQLQRIKGTEKC